jgi:hypothetical protein
VRFATPPALSVREQAQPVQVVLLGNTWFREGVQGVTPVVPPAVGPVRLIASPVGTDTISTATLVQNARAVATLVPITAPVCLALALST